MSDFFSALKTWVAQPFNTQQSVTGWFLFLGLIMIICFAWNQILRFIVEAAQEV